MSGSVTIAGTVSRFRPWPAFSIKPAIQWVQDSAGYWNASDRGAAQDIYESTALFQGTETTINALEQVLESNRSAITLTDFSADLFAPNVDHTGSISATVLSHERSQIHFGLADDVYSLLVRFRAISPSLLGTTPSLSGARPQEGFTADHSNEMGKSFSYDRTAFYQDRSSDIGVLRVDLEQNATQTKAILAYLLVTARTAAVAFPFATIAYPWGRSRASSNCKVKSFSVYRMNLNRWRFTLDLVEA